MPIEILLLPKIGYFGDFKLSVVIKNNRKNVKRPEKEIHPTIDELLESNDTKLELTGMYNVLKDIIPTLHIDSDWIIRTTSFDVLTFVNLMESYKTGEMSNSGRLKVTEGGKEFKNVVKMFRRVHSSKIKITYSNM